MKLVTFEANETSEGVKILIETSGIWMLKANQEDSAVIMFMHDGSQITWSCSLDTLVAKLTA